MNRFFLIIILSFLTTGCSILSPEKNNSIRLYTFSNTSSPVQYAHQNQKVLLVSIPTAMPGYETSSMMYTTDGYELKSFTKNRWIAPPANMLQSVLLQTLQQARCFKAVATPPFAGTADKVLSTQLLMLQQEFNGPTSQVHLALQITLSDNQTKQIKDQKIEVSVPTSANTPYAGVIATDRAVQQSLGEITRWVCEK